MQSIDELFVFMQALAREAGRLIVQERRQPETLTRSFKADAELVTSADIKSDALICAAIRERFPEHEILSEESAPALTGTDFERPTWIIDPIDGTVNYAHGHYQVAVSIAFVQNGDIACGVVYNPFLDEMFAAQRGGGATLNDVPIQVSDETDLKRAIIATGFPYDKSNLAPFVRQLGLVLDNCADIRRLGSAALDICWVAMGRLDGYYESLSVWDFAAAQLIAREAGARWGYFKPLPAGASPVFHPNHIVLANSDLFPQLQKVLEKS